MKYSPRITESHVCKRVDEWCMETRREYPHSHTCKGVVRGSQKYKHAGIIRRSVFRFLRYFSTVLNSFHYSPETHPESLRGSNSRGCGRSISPRTVSEKYRMSLKPALPISAFYIHVLSTIFIHE
jgi:hypothetical protein